MARVNAKPEGFKEVTHEGAKASRTTPLQQLKRSVLSNLLWENNFYETGHEIAQRIATLVPAVKPLDVANLAIKAREDYKLRHAPLFLVREMVRHATHKHLVASTLERIIQRPDELAEFLALYWKDGRRPVAKQVRKGLAAAFKKFDEYQFSKWNKDAQVRLRDVMFLVHPKPKTSNPPWTKKERKELKQKANMTEDEMLFKKIAEKGLAPAETWESDAAAGKDMKLNFEDKLRENRLGALALLRNLANFEKYNVSRELVSNALRNCKVERVLPFRFVTAAKHAPIYERDIEVAMLKCLEGMEKLKGETALIIDLSGSMAASLSDKSELTRKSAAIALSMLAQEMCEKVYIYATAGNDYTRIHDTALVPPRRGFGLVDAMEKVNQKIGGGGIFLKQCIDYVAAQNLNTQFERVIVFTDEQDCDNKCNPANAKLLGKHNYIINVASHKNGIGYEQWTKIDGFSEAALRFIQEAEKEEILQ